METITQTNTKKVSKPFKIYQVLIPIALGLIVIGWLFLDEFDPAVFFAFDFNYLSVLFILLALLLMSMRDFGMMWRFRLLTDKDLTWTQAFHINVLSEFTSAVTPAAVGGSSLVVIFLIKEGINAGRSTTIMFVNLFLDELFFLIVCPIVFLFIPLDQLFNSSSVIVSTFSVVFTGLYFTRLIWTTTMFIGIFRRPSWIKHILLTLFKLPLLNKLLDKVELLTNNLVQASNDIGNRSYAFWFKAFGMTLLTWSARFLVVNAVFMAFNPVHINHLVVFARQLILWVFMVVSPTPGGSGVTEYAFKEYYSDVFSSSSAIIFVTLVWRMISYYLYLLIGVMVIPNWIKKSFSKNNVE
ncbi:lysylphosphatidylglycerol synthase transmembrane domain-containing protein [Flavobacterium sp. UBA6031]|uniref:lysylphosphatidylglycerol synthase transmembrane domain-containing protein n=1 Tax=Flavobacterium sp. UBA6031 TaxID=1946551 RepID=UPI0025C10DEA|nr:lysylphosphatidylglycerol synthase transmembrane domain-containing protein [Flavobacterium sp. UBA6031]